MKETKNVLQITRIRSDPGRIVSRLVAAKGFDIHKTREIHFDVLTALSARRIGAYLVTCNVADFTAVREFLGFNLVRWQ
jgi:hypothetical protein